MRRCLQLQPGSLGWRRISSRALSTSGQEYWRVAVQNKNDSVNALVYIAPDDAGTVSEGLLQGMTVAVKDNICTKNMPTTCSSAMLQGKHNLLVVLARASFIVYALDFKSPYDATVVQLLNDSGVTIIGKTNCDEFGMGYDCFFRRIFGIPLKTSGLSISIPSMDRSSTRTNIQRAPWSGMRVNVARLGAAQAVAPQQSLRACVMRKRHLLPKPCTSYLVHRALATDTGGSVRLPASYCGVVGLKPSYGLISR